MVTATHIKTSGWCLAPCLQVLCNRLQNPLLLSLLKQGPSVRPICVCCPFNFNMTSTCGMHSIIQARSFSWMLFKLNIFRPGVILLQGSRSIILRECQAAEPIRLSCAAWLLHLFHVPFTGAQGC